MFTFAKKIQWLNLLSYLVVIILAVLFIYAQVKNHINVQHVTIKPSELFPQPLLGEDNALITMVIFEDFRCSHCRVFEEHIFPKVQTDFVDTNQVKVYFVNYAFLGESSIIAALASECVYKQSNRAFWIYKKALMDSQNDIRYTTEGLVSVARDIGMGIDVEVLRQCITNQDTRKALSNDITFANKLGVKGTPSVIVNNILLNNYTYDTISFEIEKAIGNNKR